MSPDEFAGWYQLALEAIGLPVTPEDSGSDSYPVDLPNALRGWHMIAGNSWLNRAHNRIPPSARHHTSHEILAQEVHIITWAIDAQIDPPEPSATVSPDGLDLMQAEAAAAVAGTDRLVLVVGPAGAGKTTMLRSAVSDLAGHGRPVFRLAPTAKAARVLETGTGMRSDTVAKLLYEHTRTDGPPRPVWQLPAGTTVIVDEAGMRSTGDLQRAQLHTERDRLRDHLTINRELARTLADPTLRLAHARQQLDALDTWADWANGHTPRPAALINAAHHLQHTGGHHTLLAEPLATWLHEHDLAPQHPAPPQPPTLEHQPRPEPPGLDIGL